MEHTPSPPHPNPQPVPNPEPVPVNTDAMLLDKLRATAGSMAAWLKFLGIVYIIQATISIVTTMFIGIIFAWIPLWMGIVLFQAGNRASTAALSGRSEELITMIDKLKLYFIINGIVMIVAIVIVIFVLVIFGAGFMTMFHEFRQMAY